MDSETPGRLIMVLGLSIFAVGGLLWLVARLGISPRLPGDIVIRRPNLTIYFPLATGLVLSLFLTLILNLILRR